ncbi:sulfurtransferase [Rhodococcus sp. NPDC003383]
MTLVSATELADLLASDEPVRVLDVRWSLAEPDGRAAYAAGHIPGAVYVDLESDLSDHTVPGRGRHPLPSADALEAALRRWGVDNGDTVVVYDDWNRAGSARAWWLLRAAGLEDVRILDGGWAAWRAAGGAESTEAVRPQCGSITLGRRDFYAGALATLTASESADLARAGVLLDARAPERFRGEVEPIDPVAGHIPGAANLPSTALLGEDGRFAPADDLRALFAAHGVDGERGAGTYCGSGVTAAVVVAAAEVAGIDLALFPGSWSQWSSDPTNPVETGPATA